MTLKNYFGTEAIGLFRGEGIPRAEGGAKQKRKPKSRERPQA